MTNQELHFIAKESERLRLLMTSEQKHLKDSLQQKKDANAHLRQSLVEIRRESDKKEVLLHKQVKELREKCVSLETDREKEKKELARFQNKEYSLSAAKIEVRASKMNRHISMHIT
jgi:peptidoglycan hydrolase CwlO-like protein